jgi:hypothetical protein
MTLLQQTEQKMAQEQNEKRKKQQTNYSILT